MPTKPASGVKVTVPSAFTVTLPFSGCSVIVNVVGSNSVPTFPDLSLLRIAIVTGLSSFAVAISGLTTGALFAAIGSKTVICNGDNGQSVV